MAEKRDYYEVLGLNRRANETEIKAAYRKFALKYHPPRRTKFCMTRRSGRYTINSDMPALKEPDFRDLVGLKTFFRASEIFSKTSSASAEAGDPEAERSVEQTCDTT